MVFSRLFAVSGTLFLSVFLVSTQSVFAFINTDALTDDLSSIESELGGDTTGLESLLSELDAAAGEDANAYLAITDSSGRNVTAWDVPKSAWFYSYVLALTELNIVSGYKDAKGNLTGSFGPGDNVTHAQAYKIALGSAGIHPESCGAPSHAQARGHWSSAYVACAEARGFGPSTGTDLNAPASRAEVLHYVLGAFEVRVPEGTPPFADSATHHYKNDIAYAHALKIVSGDTNPDGSLKGTFRPNDPITRAATSKIAKLAIELL